jgi:hypothetical protein
MDKDINILSIDAWRTPEGWDWNSWRKVGTISREKFDGFSFSNGKIISKRTETRNILKFMRESDYLATSSAGNVAVEDDQYNMVIVARGTREPLFAIEYGGTQ